jgi:ParB family transcriptional regulator, chromosome partitioning protein
MPKSPRSSAVVRPRTAVRRQASDKIDQTRPEPLLVLQLDQIEPNPHNPRQTFSEPEINALAESLKADGQLQPVVVRRTGDRYQLVAGERRWRAAQRAGIATIEAKLRDVDDREAFRLALVENFHRVGLSVAETVTALDDLAEMVGEIGLRPAARLLNTAPSWLSERLNVRSDPIIFPALESGRLSLGQASELRRAPPDTRHILMDRVFRDRPSTQTLRVWVNEAKATARRSPGVLPIPAEADHQEFDRAQRYRELLGRLQGLGPPRIQKERRVLERIRELADELLSQQSSRRHGRRSPPQAAITIPSPEEGIAAGQTRGQSGRARERANGLSRDSAEIVTSSKVKIPRSG